MKNAADLFQIMLSVPGLNFVLCWAFAILIWQGFKYARAITTEGFRLLRWVRSKTLRVSFKNALISSCIGGILLLFSDKISNQIQYIEQVYISPTLLNSDTSYWALSMYEDGIKRYTSEVEYQKVKQSVKSITASVGSTPMAMYEVCQSECGLNPFAVNRNERGDTVAVGWIQFTPAGIQGIHIEGGQVTWKQCKSWIPTRNMGAMMEATHQYMVGRAKGRTLPTSTDIYVCVFAPGFIGYGDEQVLYSLETWPAAYRQNKGLDGYGMIGEKIVKAERFVDYKITVKDMRLHIQMKKAAFLSRK